MLGLPYSSNGKESAFNAGDQSSIPGSGRSSGKGTAIHSSILPWRIVWTEKPGRLQSMGSQELDTTERLNTHMLGLVLRNVKSGSNDCSERSGKQYLALDTGE